MRLKKDLSFFSRAALTLLLMLLSTTMWAFDYTDANGITWSCTIIESTTNVSIVPKDKSSLPASVTIPSSVTDNSTSYTVTSIGASAFSGCTSLINATIPIDHTYNMTIGDDAFKNCTGLETVTFEGTRFITIGKGSFEGCTKLTAIFIPPLSNIDNNAFNGCTSLVTVIAIKSLINIGSMFPNVNSSCHFYIYNIDQIDDYTSSYSSRITVVAGIKTLAGAIATTTADPFITYDGTSYYSPGTKFTISNNGTPNGYTGECQGYKVTDISGTDITSTALSGSELTLPANGNVTVRALFDLVTYNITYDLDGGQFNSGVQELSYPSTYTVESGTLTMPLTLLSELLPHKDGYIFAGWTGPGYDEPTKTIIIPNGSYGDRTYTANWQRESYTISYKLVGGTLPPGQTNPTTYNVDTPTFTLVNPTREGYDFLGWIDMRDPMLETKPTITITQGSTGSKSYRAMWTPSESIPVTAHQPSAGGDFWATFYHADANYQVANGVTIYKGAISGSNLTLTDVTGNRIIPAGQAVVLKYTGGSLTMTKTTTDATGNYDDNDLMGGSTVTDGYTAYTLADGSNGVGFYRFTGAALNPNKAHLEIPQTAGARTFYSFSDDATAIEAPEMVSDSDDGDIYDLMGRKLQGQPTQKGIYVKQGKKYIVK